MLVFPRDLSVCPTYFSSSITFICSVSFSILRHTLRFSPINTRLRNAAGKFWCKFFLWERKGYAKTIDLWFWLTVGQHADILNSFISQQLIHIGRSFHTLFCYNFNYPLSV